jgi:hypothetical protein
MRSRRPIVLSTSVVLPFDWERFVRSLSLLPKEYQKNNGYYKESLAGK